MPTRAPRWTRHTLAEGHGWGRDRRGWVAVTGSAGLGYRNAGFQGGVAVGESGRDSARPARPRQKTAPHDRCCFGGAVLPSGATKNPRHHWPHALTTPPHHLKDVDIYRGPLFGGVVEAPRRGGPRSESQISPYPPPPTPPPSISRPAEVAAQPPMSPPPTPRPPSSRPSTHLHPTTRPQLGVGSAHQHGAPHHRGHDHAHLSAEVDTAHSRRGSWVGSRSSSSPWIPECPLPRGGRYVDSHLGISVLFLRRAIQGRADLARKQHRLGGAVFGGGAVWWCCFKPSAPLASRLNHTTTPP